MQVGGANFPGHQPEAEAQRATHSPSAKADATGPRPNWTRLERQTRKRSAGTLAQPMGFPPAIRAGRPSVERLVEEKKEMCERRPRGQLAFGFCVRVYAAKGQRPFSQIVFDC